MDRKGAYVKESSRLDNDMPILNKALVNYMAYGIPVEKTINECEDIIQFQKIVRVSSKYKVGGIGYRDGRATELLTDRTFRVFASTDPEDGYIGKMKDYNSTLEKFANTPDHMFILNGDIKDVKIPSRIDKQYYIDLAKKRLNDFGVIL